MELNEKTLSSELIFDGRLLKVYRDEVELTDGGASVREFVHHPGGAAGGGPGAGGERCPGRRGLYSPPPGGSANTAGATGARGGPLRAARGGGDRNGGCGQT